MQIEESEEVKKGEIQRGLELKQGHYFLPYK